jgi:hypothetical protein
MPGGEFQLDHVVVLVPYADLLTPPAWITDHFTLSPGGRHADVSFDISVTPGDVRSFVRSFSALGGWVVDDGGRGKRRIGWCCSRTGRISNSSRSSMMIRRGGRGIGGISRSVSEWRSW